MSVKYYCLKKATVLLIFSRETVSSCHHGSRQEQHPEYLSLTSLPVYLYVNKLNKIGEKRNITIIFISSLYSLAAQLKILSTCTKENIRA